MAHKEKMYQIVAYLYSWQRHLVHDYNNSREALVKLKFSSDGEEKELQPLDDIKSGPLLKTCQIEAEFKNKDE